MAYSFGDVLTGQQGLFQFDTKAGTAGDVLQRIGNAVLSPSVGSMVDLIGGTDAGSAYKSFWKDTFDNIGGAVTGRNQRVAADEQYEREKALMDLSHEMQLEDQSTAYQRQLPDMLKAAELTGVSPWILLDRFSPQATTAQSGSVQQRETLGLSDVLRVFALMLAGAKLSKVGSAKAVSPKITTEIPDWMVRNNMRDIQSLILSR